MIWLGISLFAIMAYLALLGGAGSKWLPALFIGGIVATVNGCSHGILP